MESPNPDMAPLEPRPFRPFKSSEEYLYAMKEDLAEWLNVLYNIDIDADNFLDKLETGVVLCQHANNLRNVAVQQLQQRQQPVLDTTCSRAEHLPPEGMPVVHANAATGSFFARDNVYNFVQWCRRLGVRECVRFETEDLVARKNERHVILCLLEVARRGARFGMSVPVLVRLEQQIDDELAASSSSVTAVAAAATAGPAAHSSPASGDLPEQQQEEQQDSTLVHGPFQQVVTNDLKSLDEMVRELVERCTCQSQYPMIRESEGKYRIGDTKTLIFVRILRNHVMVRVGGGWDTLEHYLDKHDPCRCRVAQRTPMTSRFTVKPSTSSEEARLISVRYNRSTSSDAASAATPRRTVRQWSQNSLSTTEHRRYEETSGDSSSEVSDEGYRSQGHARLAIGAYLRDGNDVTDRPESSLTQTSCESTDIHIDQKLTEVNCPSVPEQSSPDSGIQICRSVTTNSMSKANRLPQLTQALKNLEIRHHIGVVDSAQTNVADLNSCNDAPLVQVQNETPGETRHRRIERSVSSVSTGSHRHPTLDCVDNQRETRPIHCTKQEHRRHWNSGSLRAGNHRRPPISDMTFTAPSAIRSGSKSPAVNRRRRMSTQNAGNATLRSRYVEESNHTGSALLTQLLDDPTLLGNDARLLQRMRQLVNSLRGSPNSSSAYPVVTPRRENTRSRSAGRISRIPAPVFYTSSRTDSGPLH